MDGLDARHREAHESSENVRELRPRKWARGRRSGAEVESVTLPSIFTMRGGKIVRIGNAPRQARRQGPDGSVEAAICATPSRESDSAGNRGDEYIGLPIQYLFRPIPCEIGPPEES